MTEITGGRNDRQPPPSIAVCQLFLMACCYYYSYYYCNYVGAKFVHTYTNMHRCNYYTSDGWLQCFNTVLVVRKGILLQQFRNGALTELWRSSLTNASMENRASKKMLQVFKTSSTTHSFMRPVTIKT